MAERKKLQNNEGSKEASLHYFAHPQPDVQFLHSGSTLLDCALGGGWALNRICNIVGDTSTGKTLLAIEMAANFAKQYPDAHIVYNEIEAAFDQNYAAALGMPIDKVEFINDCFTVEEFFIDIDERIKENKKCLYILDSLDALSDKAEQGRDIEDGTYGATKAKQLSALFRQLVKKLANADITLTIISQIRDNINASFGRKTKRNGGRALDFYCSQIVYLSHMATLKKTIKSVERPVAIKIKAKVDKNKVGLPYRVAEFEILFGYGIDNTTSNLNWLLTLNLKGDELWQILEGFGITESTKGRVSAKVATLIDDKYFELSDIISNMVKDKWSEIETNFLPTRKKY